MPIAISNSDLIMQKKEMCRIFLKTTDKLYETKEVLTFACLTWLRTKKNALSKACLFGMDGMLFCEIMHETGNYQVKMSQVFHDVRTNLRANSEHGIDSHFQPC